MHKLVHNIHISMAGLMLALASLGNLVAPYGAFYRNSFGLVSLVLVVMLLLRVIIIPKSLSEWINAPLTASVLPTFFMGIMILSTYLKPFSATVASSLWIIVVCLHVLYILLFSWKFLRRFSVEKVFASYFIVYVGIVVASVTAPVFGFMVWGQAIFWFGLLANLILIPFMFYRYLVVRGVPELAKPTLAIFAAPTSLCLAGYLQSFPDKNLSFVVSLTMLAIFMLAFVFVHMPRLLKLPFSPSYAAFTFPFAIGAVAVKGANNYLIAAGSGFVFLSIISRFLEIWAIGITIYVFLRFVVFLFPVIHFWKRSGIKNSTQV